MKKLLAILLLFTLRVAAQDGPEKIIFPPSIHSYDREMVKKVPVLHLSTRMKSDLLPYKVDNSKNKYFPDLIDQYGFSCQQVSGVSYTFAYEMNRLRDLDSKDILNTYPASYTWNFMNDGEFYKGVSFFYSWDVLKRQGHPTGANYPDPVMLDIFGWMSGYDKYYAGMKNRLKQVYSIPVNTPEGIQTLKHYLYDHLEGSPTGGVAVFGASGQHIDNMVTIPPQSEEAGKHLQTGFYPYATHGMTIVGYNDSIRYDINGDGMFTNDVDINNDGVIDPRDWEWGAWRMANSYDIWWEDGGFCWIMYRAMALEYDEGLPWSGNSGIWNESVFVLKPETDYQPLLTMKVRMDYSIRNLISVKAGIAQDTLCNVPEHVLEFPLYNFQGNTFPLNIRQTDLQEMEIGFDLTPLLSYIVTNKPCRVFFILDEQDPYKAGFGKVDSVAFISYVNGIRVIPVREVGNSIPDNGRLVLSSVWDASFSKVSIKTKDLPVVPSSGISATLEATGGKEPYEWKLLYDIRKIRTDSVFPMISSNEIIPQSPAVPYKELILPFQFPFNGKKYDTVWMNGYGLISFKPDEIPAVYLIDDQEMIRNHEMISVFFPAFFKPAGPPDQMWYEADSHKATFRWLGKAAWNEAHSAFNFALRLYDDGRFEFFYGDCHDEGLPFRSWSGYSSGDDANYQAWMALTAEELSWKSYLFTPSDLPGNVSLSPQGELSISNLQDDRICELMIRVTDDHGISDSKRFTVSGDIDLAADVFPGEIRKNTTTLMDVVIRNRGNKEFDNLTAELSAREGIRLFDSTEQLSNLRPGDSIVLENAFSFKADSVFDDGEKIPFYLHLMADSLNVTRTVIFDFSAPEISISQMQFNDGANLVPDPGEVADLNILLTNNGSSSVKYATVRLESSDTTTTILSASEQLFDSISAYGTIDLSYRISISRYPVTGNDTAKMMLEVSDMSGDDWRFPVNLMIRGAQVAIVDLSETPPFAAVVSQTLDQLNVKHNIFKTLTNGFGDYPFVFLIPGVISSDSLRPPEEFILASYLNRGGSMYLEQFSKWKKPSAFRDLFHFSILDQSGIQFQDISGESGTMAEDMAFHYPALYDTSDFAFLPLQPSYSLFTASTGQCVQSAYDGGDYRTIASMVAFSLLTDANEPSTKKELMRRYLDFFGVDRNIHALFHADDRNIDKTDSVRFTDDSYDNITSRSWSFPGGEPSFSTEKNPVVRYSQAGTFNVSLTVTNGTDSSFLTKKNYILVSYPNGITPPGDETQSVYPNPSSNYITLQNSYEGDHLQIFNSQGKIVMDRILAEKSEKIDIRTLSPGLYIIILNKSRLKLIKI